MVKPLSGLRLLLRIRANLVILIQISTESTLQTPMPLRPRLVTESMSYMELLSLAVHLRLPVCHSLFQRPLVVFRPKRHQQLRPPIFVVLRRPKRYQQVTVLHSSIIRSAIFVVLRLPHRYQLATVLQLHSSIPHPATFVVLRLPKRYQLATPPQLHSSIICQLINI